MPKSFPLNTVVRRLCVGEYIDRMKNIEINTATIEQFNLFVMQQDIDQLPIGLFEGKMGLAIYFYHQARLTNEKRYKTFANKLLNSMYEQIHSKLPVDLKSGLTGICFGILYLIETGFIKGNPNFVLKDLDDKIINTLYFSYFFDNQHIPSDDLKIIAHCLLYLCKRLTDNKLSKNEKHIFEQIVIRAVNKIETAISTEKMAEPWLFSQYDYDGHFYDTTDIVREMYFKNRQLKILETNQYKMNLPYSAKSLGGAFMANRQAYIGAGMENEEFYGWGPEDLERWERWRIFGYKIYRAKGNLYHLSHSRGNNSMHRSPDQFVNTNKRCKQIALSNAQDLKNTYQ